MYKRQEQYGDALDKYFRLGSNLNQRDTIAVRKMVGGLLKLVYPDGEFSKEQLEEILKLALEIDVYKRQRWMRLPTPFSIAANQRSPRTSRCRKSTGRQLSLLKMCIRDSAANLIARQAGISSVRAQVLPQDKHSAVEEFKNNGKDVYKRQ